MRALAILVCAAAFGGDPAPLIRLQRTPLLPGSGPALIRPYADSGVRVDVVAMTSVSGAAEHWLLELHDSFGSIEEVDKAIGASAALQAQVEASPDSGLAPSRAVIAIYRPGWSYRPDEAMKALPRARYLMASIHRVRLGAETEFSELVQRRQLTFDSTNVDRPQMAYQVVSGAQSGTWLFLTPVASLRTFDNGFARTPVYAEGIPRGKSADSELSREHLLFRLQPRFSRVSDEFGAPDAEFWNTRPPQQQ